MKIKLYHPRNPNMPSISWLVFNRNQRERRASRELFIKKFGKAAYDANIKRFEAKGIMSIFEGKPDKFTAFYVNTMAKMVDDRTCPIDKATDTP